MSKKIVILIVLMTMLSSLLLVACSESNQSSQPSVNGSEQQSADNEGVSEPEKKGNVEISMILWFPAETTPDWHGAVDDFMAKYPNIKVKTTDVPFGDFWQKMPTMVAGNTLPDVFLTVGNQAYRWMKDGIYLDLSQFIDKEPGDFVSDNFWEGSVDVYTYDGKIYAFPYDISVPGLYYNKDLFKAAGISEPTKDWTTDDLLEAAKKLTKDTNGDGKIDQWGVWGNRLGWPDWTWPTFGGRAFNDDYSECLLDSPENVKALQYWADLTIKYHVAPSPAESQALPQGFASGKVAMQLIDSTLVALFRQQVGNNFAWDVSYWPKGSGPNGGAAGYQGGAFVGNAKTKYPAETWELIKWMTGQEALTRAVSAPGRSIPGNKKAVGPFLELNPPEHISIFTDTMESGYAEPMPVFPYYDDYANILKPYIDQVYLGSKTAADALKEAKQEVDKLIQDRGLAK